MKGAFGLSLSAGWHTEVFARTQKMKSLGEYLNPPSKDDKKRALVEMFQRKRMMQEAANGSR